MAQTRDRSQVAPEPKNPDFLEWLLTLFDGISEFPEKIEVVTVSGPACRQMGGMVKQVIFKPGQPKPGREELVKLSNEIMHLTQKDCDGIGKKQRYGVLACHFSRNDEYYSRYVLVMQPKGVFGAAEGDDDDDEDGEGKKDDPKARFAHRILDHGERMFEMFSEAFGGIMDRQDRIVERQQTTIDLQQQRLNDLLETTEKLRSQEHQRELDRQWMDLKIGTAQKGVELVAGLLPVLVNKLSGKTVATTGESAESMILGNFFKSLSTEQYHGAFGFYDEKEPHDLITPGIFTLEQARILWDVSKCIAPPMLLNQLMEGPLAVTEKQMEEAQKLFSMEQLIPLVDMIMTRKKQLEASRNQPPSPPETPAA